MKKFVAMLLALMMLLTCASALAENQKIDKLTVGFVPSRDPEDIKIATEPLKGLLTAKLAELGYDVGEVVIEVGTNYNAVGEGMAADTIDVGLVPGGTYIMYDDGCKIILTATRAGKSKDFPDAKDWNDGQPTTNVDHQVKYYRSLLIAGWTEKAQAVAAKVNAGEMPTWEELDGLTWAITSSTTSSAGYIYPTLWLYENYGKTLLDLSNMVACDGYASCFARLGAGQADILAIYADGRQDYEEKWNTDFGRTDSIWASTETNVIGVTQGIYNDTVCVRATMDDALAGAIAQAFIEIAKTEEGLQVISIYNHEGYETATSEEYDVSRAVAEMVQNIGK